MAQVYFATFVIKAGGEQTWGQGVSVVLMRNLIVNKGLIVPGKAVSRKRTDTKTSRSWGHGAGNGGIKVSTRFVNLL